MNSTHPQNIWCHNPKDCNVKILSFFQHIWLTGYVVILQNQKIILYIESLRLLVFCAVENLSQAPWMVSPHTCFASRVSDMILFTLWCSEITSKILNTAVLLTQISWALYISGLRPYYYNSSWGQIFWVQQGIVLLSPLLLYLHSQIMWGGANKSM